MELNTTKEEQRLNSKAPFMAAIVFFAIAWTSRASLLAGSAGGNHFEIIAMALYGFLGVAATVGGVYLQVTGAKTIDPPRARHLVWLFVFLVVVAAIAMAVISVQSSPFE